MGGCLVSVVKSMDLCLDALLYIRNRATSAASRGTLISSEAL